MDRNPDDGHSDDDGFDDVSQEDQSIDGDSVHDESQDSESDDVHGFLDLEASEADSEARSEVSESSDDVSEISSFPQFMKLPLEIRDMIWKAFCPDLDSPRVFELHMNDWGSSLKLAPHVESQTAPLRAVLAVHRESRALGQKSAPNGLELNHGQGYVPCHYEKDVFFIDLPLSLPDEVAKAIDYLDMLAPMARNIAFPSTYGVSALDEDLPYLDKHMLGYLRNVYMVHESDDFKSSTLTWCVSDKVNTYHVKTQEEEPGLGEDLEMLYCWPDVDKHREYAEDEIVDTSLNGLDDHDGENIQDERIKWKHRIAQWQALFRTMIEDPVFSDDDQEPDDDRLEIFDEFDLLFNYPPREVNVWPMVVFGTKGFDRGVERFQRMQAWEGSWDDWVSDTESTVNPEDFPPLLRMLDEYESDGIDDEPVDDFLVSDDDDDLPGHLLYDSAQDESSDTSVQNFDSRANEHLAAQFSTDSESDDEGDEGDGTSSQSAEEEHRPSRPSRQKRFAELDSDESVTEAGDSPQPTKLRGRVVLDDSEADTDEGAQESRPAQGARRRGRPMLDDSDEEDEQDEDEGPRRSRATNHRARRGIPSDPEDEEDGSGAEASSTKTKVAQSDSSSEEEVSSDEEPPPAKRLSLAKRLQMEYKQSRGSRGVTNDSEDEGSDEIDADSDDDDGSEKESDRDGMVMGMAEEGDEDDDDDDAGY